MLAHVFVTKKKDEESGYTNTSFRLQGLGLNGTVPVRVCYFGKPVMEPVMVRVVDAVTKKDKLDKDGKPVFTEKRNDDGTVVTQEKKDPKTGKPILRDDDFKNRVELLSMFSGIWDTDVVAEPVEIIAKLSPVQKANGEKYNYYAVCGNEEVPIEVTDFSTPDRPDYSYRSNCVKLAAMAKRV